MKNLSSYNHKKTKSKNWQLYHNERLKSPDYLIDEPNVEVSLKFAEAIAERDRMIKEAIEAYQRTKKPKAPNFKAKSYLWSAVVNIKEDTTMDDLKRFTSALQKKYGFQCYQIAIHRDEGHFDKGEKKHNLHAHLEFVTLDKETGINRQREVRKAQLSDIQDLCAKELGMQRGENYYKTAKEMEKIGIKYEKPSRIEPRGYAKIKEKEKLDISSGLKLKATVNELKAFYHANIKKLQNQGAETQLFKAERAKFEALCERIKAKNLTKDELKAEYTTKEPREKSKDELLAEIVKNSFSQQAIAELHRAQQKIAQNREVSHESSSAANIEQQKPQVSPQTTQSVEIQPQSATADKNFKGEEKAKSEALADELLAFGNVVKSIFNAQYKTLAEILFPHAYQNNLKDKEVAILAQKAEKLTMPYQITKNLTKDKYAFLMCDKKENLDIFYKTFKDKSIKKHKELEAKYPNARLESPNYTKKTLQDIENSLQNKGYEVKIS